MWDIAAQCRGMKISGPFKLTLHAVAPDKRHRDLDNLFKATLDAVVAAGVVEDDRHCRWIEARWVDAGPACTIMIEGLGNERSGE